MTEHLTCPKCHGSMRRYERNGVNIDQCTECRGVFLDRGELEHLIDAEAAYSQGRQPGQTPPASQPGHSGWSQPQAPSYGYDRRGDDHRYSGHRGKRRKSFLEEFFD